MISYGGHRRIKEGKPLVVRVGIKNVGQTPALRFWGSINTYIRPTTNPPRPMVKINVDDAEGEFLGPTKCNEFRNEVSNELSHEDYMALKSGEKAIFTVGLFRYKDIYGCWHLFEINLRNDEDLKIRGFMSFGSGVREHRAKADKPSALNLNSSGWRTWIARKILGLPPRKPK
ncbi:hypothetical protein NRB_34100 [Novosphingobium sp. 11B]